MHRLVLVRKHVTTTYRTELCTNWCCRNKLYKQTYTHIYSTTL